MWRIAIFLLFLQQAWAQTPAYLHYSTRDELPANLVHCGWQDRQGLLWFGTEKGLARFDGTRFRAFSVADGLPDPEVLGIYEDRRGRLWFSCFRNKISYYQAGHFITGQHDSLLNSMTPKTGVYDFFEAHNGDIWVAGLNREVLCRSDAKVEKMAFPSSMLRFVEIEGQLFGLGRSQIVRVAPDHTPTVVYTLPSIISNGQIPVLGACAQGNRILYAFIDRLLLLEWDGVQFQILTTLPRPLGKVFVDSKGRFWVCSINEGAICFDNTNRDLTNPVAYLQNKKVTALFEDRQGTFWFCTTNGIYALPLNAPLVYNRESGQPFDNVTALARSRRGELLSGDEDGNTYVWKQDTPVTMSLSTWSGLNRCRQIIETADDNYVIATEKSLYLQKNGQNQLPRNVISPKAIHMQGKNIWVGTFNRLLYFPKDSVNPVLVKTMRITTLGEDSEGCLWAGGLDGLFSQKDSFQDNWGTHFPLLQSRILAIERAGSEGLWVATPESGLLLVKTSHGRVTDVQRDNHLPASSTRIIQSLFAEPQLGGGLWLATNQGVFGLRKTIFPVHFGQFEGLADDDVNNVLVHDDTLWAATASGLTCLLLRPSALDSNFSTLVTRLQYQEKKRSIVLELLDSMPENRKIILPSEATLVQIDVAGLDYLSRGNIHYECVLTKTLPPWYFWTFPNLFDWVINGFAATRDTTWAQNGRLNLGVVLSSGRYILQVTAINSAAVRSSQPAVLQLVQTPYWYTIFWIDAVLLAAIGYGLWRLYQARLAFIKLEVKAAELQLQMLQTQMNPHFIGNSINAIQQFFYPPQAEIASEYIAIFTRLLRQTMQFSDKNFIPIREELAYLTDYLQMIQLRLGDRFEYAITGSQEIPPETLFPTMLLQPLLENATMHGLWPCGLSMLQVDFSLTDKKLRCKVTDNGLGWSKKQAMKANSEIKTVSKGLELLGLKISSLNQRHDMHLEFRLEDLADDSPPTHGTRVIIEFITK